MPLVVRGRSMAEKTKEQLQIEAEKAKQALQGVSEKLHAAEKELTEKPKDEKLKKKVEGLAKAFETAKQKADAGEAALKEAESKNGAEENASSETGKKKVRLRVRSTTGYPQYYRAGLCFKKVDTEYEVPEDVAKILKADCWLIVEEVK